MQNLEIFLINLFMRGEEFSKQDKQPHPNLTIIKCENFEFEFEQLDSQIKQNDYINKNIITTKVTIENVNSDQIEHLLNIIDELCLLLSFTQQSPIRRCGYKIGSNSESINCSAHLINPYAPIIRNHGADIRIFLEQTYLTFKQLKSIRQLHVVFGYLCEANRFGTALEISLLAHYVAIENLKHTFATRNGFKQKDSKYFHPEYPKLFTPPLDLDNYVLKEGEKNHYSHKVYGECGSTEMTKRMFEACSFKREEITPFLKKRHRMIHEGILLPIGENNYMEQAIDDRRNVSDLLRKYLLTLLNYKGAYYLSRDRLGASGYIP